MAEPISNYIRDGKLISGYSYTRLYRIWSLMKHRCYNSRDKRYHVYGGKGIAVCDEWKHDFPTFALWAVANGYQEDLTIDRIDVNEGYSPSNCRWVDMKVQQNNRSNNHQIEFRGETHNLIEWARICGLDHRIIGHRLKVGWSIEKSLTTPVMTYSEAGKLGDEIRWKKQKGERNDR